MIKCLMKCINNAGNWSFKKQQVVERSEKEKYDRAYDFLWLIYRENSLSLKEMYKLYTQSVFQPLKCLNASCNNIVNSRGGKKINKQFGFAMFCSNSCLTRSEYRKNSINSTCMERYGGLVGFGNDHQRNKACETMKEKYGVEYYVLHDNFESKRTNTFMGRYGVTSPMKSPEVRATHQNNMRKKHGVFNSWIPGKLRTKGLKTTEKIYGDSQIMATVYLRDLKESTNTWLSLDQKTHFELYCRSVKKFTEKSLRENTIENLDLRKRCIYSLDHIYSKKQGFIDNIPPFIIGSHINLKIIPHSDNSSKGSECGMTQEQLFTSYYSG